MNKDWSRLYDEYASHVRAILYRMGLGHELDDVVQECFIKVWKGMGEFRNEASLKTWISRIAVNAAHDHFRRKGVNLQSEELNEAVLAAPEFREKDLAEEQLVRAALQSLSVPHREVLVLHVMEEHTVEEVAAITGTSPGTVKSRLFHARANMQKILEKRGLRYGT